MVAMDGGMAALMAVAVTPSSRRPHGGQGCYSVCTELRDGQFPFDHRIRVVLGFGIDIKRARGFWPCDRSATW